MNLISPALNRSIDLTVIPALVNQEHASLAKALGKSIEKMHAAIPAKKRISYGAHYVVKTLGAVLYERLVGRKIKRLEPVRDFFAFASGDQRLVRPQAVALQIICCWAAQSGHDYAGIVPVLEQAAASEDWELREHTAGFMHALILKQKKSVQQYFIRLAKSRDPKLRRFVAETLRPVAACQWIQKEPEYSLKVLRLLFKEASPYPRTSVGNNLSDLARKNPELIYAIVQELVASKDRNAYWIAYRACRNLVKKEPERVMDLLQVDDYKYKDRYYQRMA